MRRLPRPAVIAAIGLAVAGIAVAFGLMLADIEDTDVERPVTARGGNGATTATPVPPATATPAPTRAPTRAPATATPATARNQPNRGQSPRGRLDQLGRDISNAATFGVITDVSRDRITVKTVGGGSFSTAITSKTEIWSGAKKLKTTSLREGDSVFIVSMDGGATAFSINSFGELATLP
jgi:hypothetical protein